MNAPLSQSERDRIARDYGAKVPDDVTVKHIPRGMSSDGLASSDLYEWDGKALKAKDPEAAKRHYANGHWSGVMRRGKGPDASVSARRNRLKELAEAGKTGDQIRRELGISASVFYSDLRKAGLKAGDLAQPKKRPQNQYLQTRRAEIVEENRDKVKAAFDGVKSVSDLSRETGMNRKTVREHLAALNLTAPAGTPGYNPEKSSVVEERRAKIPGMVEEGMNGPQIADAFGVSTASIYGDAKALGIKLPRGRRGKKGARKIETAREERAERRVEEIRDRRRFKTVPVPIGDPQFMTDADATGSIFPSRVFDVTEAENVLKDGANNSKIGGDVLKGKLRGARIFTLTLEERATCPKSCHLWRGCYGNAMQHARRWRHGPELIEALELELSDICGRHDKVLVRLHVLGDFYSAGYVDFWRKALKEHPGLHCFGFTAWKQGTEIGDAIAKVREDFPSRFAIRHSNMTGKWGSFTLDFPTEKKRIGDAIVCPEQSEAMRGQQGRHCGNCALCWQTDLPIAFVEH